MTDQFTSIGHTSAKAIAELNARIDRLPRSGLHPLVFLIVGLSYFFAFYEISTFAYTLPTMKGVLGLAGNELAYPVSANLAGYAIGSFLLGRLADQRGRRVAMMLTVAIVALAAVLTAASWDIWSLTAFRFLSGVGTGAEIVLAATLISELSPSRRRGRYVMWNYIWGAAGLACTPFIAIALLRVPDIGWRLVYIVGAVAALLILFMRGRLLPESPRWLVLHGRTAEADTVVSGMEERCLAQTGRELPPVPDAPAEELHEGKSTASELFRHPYLRRTAVVFGFWFLMYIANYSYLSYLPAILIDAGLSAPSGLLYSGIGQLGLPVGAVIALLVADRVERKYYLVCGTLVYALGFAIVALGSSGTQIMLGSALISVAFAACAVAYVYTAEIFPTRLRSTGSALGNGVGHLGGVVAPFIAVALLGSYGGRVTLWAMAAIVAVAALLLAVGGIRTSGRQLTDLAQ
jgi:putative MFS transporter